MPNVIYRIQLSGMEQAIAGLKAVHGSAYAPENVKTSWGGVAAGLDHVSDSAKKVARDMDATGNKVAESSLKAIDNITGLAAAMASGPFSLVGAIGLVVGGFAIYNTLAGRNAEIDKQAKAAVDSLTASTRALAEQQVTNQEADSKQLEHRQKVVDLTIQQNALNLQAMYLNVMGFRMMAEEQRRTLKDFSITDPMGVRRVAEYQNTVETLRGLETGLTAATKAQEDLRTESASVSVQHRKALSREEKEARVKAEIEANERSAAAAIEFDQRTQREAQAREDAQTERLARADEAERKSEQEREERVDEAMAQDRDQYRQEKEHDDARLDALRIYDQAYKRALEEERKELERLRQEQIRASLGMVYANSVNASFTVGMYAVGKSIDFASSELMQFQDINRDNWRDMLQITEDTKAAFAARLQAFLFSTAIEAGKMAIWENAEGIKETALGAGALFTNPAEAASHFVSAGLHYAASAAYGTFAGGAAVGAGVVASQRGEGGLFASAPSGGGGYGSGGAGGGGGPSGGSYSGGGERGGGGPVVINITNEPGSMPPDDQDRAAMAVARHVRRAQQDWFTSQEMGG